MANDQVRPQVREDTDDHDWVDVGHKTIDETVPVTIYESPGVPLTILPNISHYQLNHMDDGDTATNVLYIGLSKDDDTYCIKKLDETSSTLPTMTYATILNNSGVTNYADAWTGRVSLTYGTYQQAF